MSFQSLLQFKILNNGSFMIVTRPLSPNEPDLLKGNETKQVVVVPLSDDRAEFTFNPQNFNWTHNELEQLSERLNQKFTCGWDAYFESLDNWIGSSEL